MQDTIVGNDYVPGADYLEIERHIVYTNAPVGYLVVVDLRTGVRVALELAGVRHLVDALVKNASALAGALVLDAEYRVQGTKGAVVGAHPQAGSRA